MFRTLMLTTALTMASPWALSQDIHLARNLAATCANCHGTNGRVQGSDVKALAGLPAARITAAMSDFKSGAVPASIMHQIAKGYSDEQVRLIAGYFAAQQPGK